MDLRAIDVVQQEIGPHVLLIRLHNSCQVDHGLEAVRYRSPNGLHGMVGLGGTVGEHIVTAILQRLSNEELQFAGFVAAKEVLSAEVIPLDVEVDPQLFGQLLQPVQRRWEKTQGNLWNALQKLFDRFQFHDKDLLIHCIWVAP